MSNWIKSKYNKGKCRYQIILMTNVFYFI